MTHDPLCPMKSHSKFCEGCTPQCGTCQCDLIAKVRRDEVAEARRSERAATLDDVADAMFSLGFTGGDIRKVLVDRLDALRNSR